MAAHQISVLTWLDFAAQAVFPVGAPRITADTRITGPPIWPMNMCTCPPPHPRRRACRRCVRFRTTAVPRYLHYFFPACGMYRSYTRRQEFSKRETARVRSRRLIATINATNIIIVSYTYNHSRRSLQREPHCMKKRIICRADEATAVKLQKKMASVPRRVSEERHTAFSSVSDRRARVRRR